MKTPAVSLLLVLLCLSASGEAQNRQWKGATVAKITTETADGGLAVLPLGGAVFGVPITHHRVFYHIETEDVTYVLAWVNKKNPLNVTLGGKTKVALDRNGRDAHILDDAGKEVKIPIARKIAKPKEASSASLQQPIQLPENGNGLLDWCNHVLEVLDRSSDPRPSERLKAMDPDVNLKFGWCLGYLRATSDVIVVARLNLAFAASRGGPSKAALEFALPLSRICSPQEASGGQLTRVLVKWLHDHPERLHEPMTNLTLDALRDAFPCPADAPAKKPDTP